MISDDKDLQLRVMATFDQWRNIAQLPDQSQTRYVTGNCTVYEAFWRTTLGDVMWESPQSHSTKSDMFFERFRRTVPEDELIWRKYVDWTKDLVSDMPREGLLDKRPWNQQEMELPVSNTYFGSRCMNRTFFITEKGYMGIGPLQTQPGDVIHLLCGSTVPFVLRKDVDHYPPKSPSVVSRVKVIDSIKLLGGKHHRLVGDCFVHGVMDGEFCNELKVENVILR
jgi:hypothetical protein